MHAKLVSPKLLITKRVEAKNALTFGQQSRRCSFTSRRLCRGCRRFRSSASDERCSDNGCDDSQSCNAAT
jgi:hypothetical protein